MYLILWLHEQWGLIHQSNLSSRFDLQDASLIFAHFYLVSHDFKTCGNAPPVFIFKKFQLVYRHSRDCLSHLQIKNKTMITGTTVRQYSQEPFPIHTAPLSLLTYCTLSLLLWQIINDTVFCWSRKQGIRFKLRSSSMSVWNTKFQACLICVKTAST